MAAWRQGSVHALSGVPAAAAGSVQQSSQSPGHRRGYFNLRCFIVIFPELAPGLAERVAEYVVGIDKTLLYRIPGTVYTPEAAIPLRYQETASL
jgi:hypothetical protein